MIPKIRGPLLPYMEPGSFHVSRGSAYSSVFLCHNVVSLFLLLAVINTDTLYNHTGEFTSALKKKKSKAEISFVPSSVWPGVAEEATGLQEGSQNTAVG